MDRDHLPVGVRDDIFKATKDHPRSEIRDLFERFVPDAERIRRLGDNIAPETILSLSGNPERGKQVFFAESTQCKNCHRVGNVGETLGPDLSKVGSKYAKPALLENLLDPSRTIEPNYQTYVVATKSGQIVTGLLVDKTDREVVLTDAEKKTLRIPASDVDQMAPQPKSLMPDSLLRDLTAQQAADLVEFLASQR
jgi:putative heme-binding domain-containing protein